MLIALGVIKAGIPFDKVESMRADWPMVCDAPDLLFCKFFHYTYLCRLISKFFNLFRMKKAYVSKQCNEKRMALEIVEIEVS